MAKFIRVSTVSNPNVLVNLYHVQTIEKLSDTNELKTTIHFSSGTNATMQVLNSYEELIEQILKGGI